MGFDKVWLIDVWSINKSCEAKIIIDTIGQTICPQGYNFDIFAYFFSFFEFNNIF